ncbi:MAG: hypothetical protein HQ546_10025 [Planctomycetes bacterium]|nr:hypothetical protein [Planctomycetota bacterium]
MTRQTIITAWALALLAGLANGQVRQLQTGRVLDVNPQYGSGGMNSIRTADQPGVVSGNLYITGQVSGGFGFRGHIPYVGQNELSLTLPSEALDNFNRDSIGLQNVIKGRTYLPQLYNRPAGTVYSLPVIGAEASLTGAAELPGLLSPTGVVPSPAAPVSVSGARGSTPAAWSLPTLPVKQVDRMALFSSLPPSVVGAGAEQESRAEISTLFGIQGLEDRERLAFEFARGNEVNRLTEGGLSEQAQVEGESVDERVPTKAPYPKLAAAGQEPLIVEPSGEVTSEEQDVFDGLVARLIRWREEGLGVAVTQPIQAPEAELERLDTDPAQRTQATDARDGQMVTVDQLGVVLRQLSGRRADPFNNRMALGDAELKAGNFYQAAWHYEMAQSIDRANPLASVGAGLAYVGAGESYRASRFFQRALKVFPPLVRARIEIDNILGKEVTDRRLSQLLERLGGPSTEAKIPLVFLATFIQANRGETQLAFEWGQKLKSFAGESPDLLAYAEFLIAANAQPSTTASEEQ